MDPDGLKAGNAEDGRSGVRAIAIRAVAENVKRLIADARLLQGSGSAGTALSLAILAFEEAGKGHILEHDWQKPKHLGSHHSHRHLMAFHVLYASFIQKYGIEPRAMYGSIIAHYEAAGLKPGKKQPLPPMTNELREQLRAILLPQFTEKSPDEIMILGIEQRWIGKIGAAVRDSGLEKLRQSGLYLDTDDAFTITSSPMQVEKLEAERWIWAATRVLNLLERGEYFQPYSPLSELIARAKAGDADAQQELDALRAS